MAQPLTETFGITHDLVALVGAGGKTTLMFALAAELLTRETRVVLTTTTMMGAGQSGGFPVVSPDESDVASTLDVSVACLVVGPETDGKIAGVDPQWVDQTWRSGIAETLIVEADGARRKPVKAPAEHEPVIPGETTLVIAMISAEAIDRVVAEVAHRPELVAAVAGCRLEDRLTPVRAAALLASPEGGRKSVPGGARFVVAVSRSHGAEQERARELAELLRPIPAILLPALG